MDLPTIIIHTIGEFWHYRWTYLPTGEVYDGSTYLPLVDRFKKHIWDAMSGRLSSPDLQELLARTIRSGKRIDDEWSVEAWGHSTLFDAQFAEAIGVAQMGGPKGRMCLNRIWPKVGKAGGAPSDETRALQSEVRKEYHAGLTKEERAATQHKRCRTLGPDGLTRVAKKRAATLGPEGLAEVGRKGGNTRRRFALEDFLTMDRMREDKVPWDAIAEHFGVTKSVAYNAHRNARVSPDPQFAVLKGWRGERQ